MNHCTDCKNWTSNRNGLWGKCDRVREKLFFCSDMCDAAGDLFTRHDFSCVMWEESEIEELGEPDRITYVDGERRDGMVRFISKCNQYKEKKYDRNRTD